MPGKEHIIILAFLLHENLTDKKIQYIFIEPQLI